MGTCKSGRRGQKRESEGDRRKAQRHAPFVRFEDGERDHLEARILQWRLQKNTIAQPTL